MLLMNFNSQIKQKIKIRIQCHCYMRIKNNKLLQELGTT